MSFRRILVFLAMTNLATAGYPMINLNTLFGEPDVRRYIVAGLELSVEYGPDRGISALAVVRRPGPEWTGSEEVEAAINQLIETLWPQAARSIGGDWDEEEWRLSASVCRETSRLEEVVLKRYYLGCETLSSFFAVTLEGNPVKLAPRALALLANLQTPFSERFRTGAGLTVEVIHGPEQGWKQLSIGGPSLLGTYGASSGPLDRASFDRLAEQLLGVVGAGDTVAVGTFQSGSYIRKTTTFQKGLFSRCFVGSELISASIQPTVSK
jgi:hypothetical protein